LEDGSLSVWSSGSSGRNDGIGRAHACRTRWSGRVKGAEQAGIGVLLVKHREDNTRRRERARRLFGSAAEPLGRTIAGGLAQHDENLATQKRARCPEVGQ
jgi:hypothetical protein